MGLQYAKILGLAAACLVVVGSAGQALGGPSACTLLTQAQVGAALGAGAGQGEPIGQNGCGWAVGGKRLTLTLEAPDMFTYAKAPVPKITKIPVSGVGDDAVYAVIGNLASLTVKKRSTVFVVRIYGFPLDESKAKEKTIALDVAAKV